MDSLPPERPSDTKFLDSLFSGAPHGILTSDEGLRLKYLQDISRTLDRHREATERSLAMGNHPASREVPQYLPQPEIIINTDELARSQSEVAEQVTELLDAQRDLVEATRAHTPLYKRMISNQGITHVLLEEGNRLSRAANDHLAEGNAAALRAVLQAFHQRETLAEGQRETNNLLSESITLQQEGNEAAASAAARAFEQRNAAARQLARGLVMQEEMIEQLGGVRGTVAFQAEQTRRLLHTLLTDIGRELSGLSNEQTIARIASLQALYRVRSAFLQTHEQVMWSHQQQRGILERILEAVEMTDAQRESKRSWKKAERLRQGGQLEDALTVLERAHALDDANPLVYLSAGTIHSTFGNDERAALAFAEADALLEGGPAMTAFTLLNLAGSLQGMGRHEHAERVLRRATKAEPLNPEAWFHYGKACIKAGLEDRGIEVLRTVLRTHLGPYQARLENDEDLRPFAERLRGS